MLELDQDQRAAAEATGPDVWISAGPGAGKTRIIAARVAHLMSRDVGGHQVAAITYTRSMAVDLKRRIVAALPDVVRCDVCGGACKIGGFDCAACGGRGGLPPVPPVVGTLHSLAASWVRRALRGELAGADQILALRWVSGADFGIAQPEDVDDLVHVAYHEVRRRVSKMALRQALMDRGEQLRVFTPRTEARRQLAMRNLASFHDLLAMLDVMVRAPRGSGRPPHLADMVTQILVDEAQDLASMHWSILDAWRPAGLTVAGDDAQSIYAFMHAEARVAGVQMFGERLAAAPRRFEVGRNYRSAASIVADCRRVRRSIASGGACSDLELEAVREDQSCAVVIESVDLDDPAAPGPTWHVAGLIEGGDHPAAAERRFAPEEIAVLARTWDELEMVGAGLRDAGIPFAVPERGRDRWRSVAGRAVVSLARSADRGVLDDQDARTVLRALGHADPAAIVAEAMAVAMARGIGLAEAMDEHVVARAGLKARWWSLALECVTTDQLAQHIEDADVLGGRPLVDAAQAMASWEPSIGTGEDDEPAPAAPGEWLTWLASDESGASIKMKPGHVVLTTIHGAKGLEWPAVVVVGASEGALPGPYDQTPDRIAEAGRILYVAMTRARDVLRVICPANLRGKPRSPSRWLVDAGLIDAASSEAVEET